MTSTAASDRTPVQVTLPDGVRCAMAMTYDTDMAAGYAPDGVCHGRSMPALKSYILRLCDTAEQLGVRLHFFQIANGLEPTEDVGYLREVLDGGHDLDSHTYSHEPLNTEHLGLLHRELSRADELFEERLGHTSTVLRGPGGYEHGLRGLPDNQQVILDNGFRWVSCEYNFRAGPDDYMQAVSGPAEDVVYAYDSGLIELPIMSLTDRNFFDSIMNVDRAAYEAWRAEWGHRAVGESWTKAPWTADDALDRWIDYNLSVADFAYQNALLWVVAWHPYSHYLHDPENRALPALLRWAAERDGVLVCTLRDVVEWIEPA
ncbi:MAG: polysaccharide deacetylase family protein [Armatimonadota bacterium]|nr:polysaccharide deacetylase family protein [Armatimonadota bacterium]